MKNEINHTESNPRSFYVDTPLGKLRIYSKMLGIDIPENFPGVYVDYISPISKEPITLSCTEYDPSKNAIQTTPYELAWCDDPSAVFVHQDLDCLDLDFVEQNIRKLAAEMGLTVTSDDDSTPHAISITSGTEVFPGIKVVATVNFNELNVCKHIIDTSSRMIGPDFEIGHYSSLEELNDHISALLAQSDTFVLSEKEAHRFAKDKCGRTWLRYTFQKDIQIVLDQMEDIQAVEPGTVGEVLYVDDAGTIHVRWPSGSSLGLVFGVDQFHLADPSVIATDERVFDPKQFLEEITSPEICSHKSFKLQRVVADSVNVDIAMLLDALKNNCAEDVLLALTDKSAETLFREAGLLSCTEI